MTSVRTRPWVFTINNYDKYKNTVKDDLDYVMSMKFQYMCFGFETCPRTGTPHIQGFVYFKHAKTMQAVKELLPRAHLAPAKASVLKNQIYCSKESDFYEFGDPPDQGRAAFEKIEEAMNDPRSNFHLYHQYRKAFKEMQMMHYDSSKHREVWVVRSSCYDDLLSVIPSSYSLCCYPSEYMGDFFHIVSAYTYPIARIKIWQSGRPFREKNGYEYVNWDPNVLIILYDDEKELNYLTKNIFPAAFHHDNPIMGFDKARFDAWMAHYHEIESCDISDDEILVNDDSDLEEI